MFRRETALSAYRGVARMEEKESLGERRLYRLQTDGAISRYKRKVSAKSEWFKGREDTGLKEWHVEGSGPSTGASPTPSPSHPPRKPPHSPQHPQHPQSRNRKSDVKEEERSV